MIINLNLTPGGIKLSYTVYDWKRKPWELLDYYLAQALERQEASPSLPMLLPRRHTLTAERLGDLTLQQYLVELAHSMWDNTGDDATLFHEEWKPGDHNSTLRLGDLVLTACDTGTGVLFVAGDYVATLLQNAVSHMEELYARRY